MPAREIGYYLKWRAPKHESTWTLVTVCFRSQITGESQSYAQLYSDFFCGPEIILSCLRYAALEDLQS